jgi:glycosyltransferase involved in cell wall biosynthesis
MFASITSQTRQPDEVVLIDDASNDGTAEVLQSLLAAVPRKNRGRYRLIRNDRNEGQAASLNRAIEATTSDAVMILNDDDFLMPDAVEVSLGLFARHPDIALLGAHSIHFAGQDPRTLEPRTIAAQLGALDLTLDIRRPADALQYRGFNDLNMTHSGSSFLRLAWVAVGGYDPDPSRRIVPFSDRDFQLRINALFSVGLSPVVAFSFWRSDSSVDYGRNT